MIKKITILTLLSIFSLIFFIPANVMAEESEFEYSESFGLSYEDYKKDGLYIGDQRIYLNSSGLTAITFDLADQIELLTYPAFFQVDEIYLKVMFSSVPIADNTEISSPDSTMVKEDFTYDPAITTTAEADNFYHYFSVSDIANIEQYATTFYYSTDNPEAVAPFVYHATLNVHYTMADGALDDVVDVGTDYELLPDTSGEFVDIFSLELYDLASLSYTFMFIYNGQFYSFDLAIPEEIYSYDYISPYVDEPVHFVDFLADQMSYASKSTGEKVLYIQPIIQRSNHPAVSGDDGSELIVGFVTINLITMQYQVINKLELTGIVNKEADRFAALYCFFPAEVEELLSITVSYSYRINSFLGIKGAWQTTINTYAHGESYAGHAPVSWLWWLSPVISGAAVAEDIWGTKYDIEDVVIPINERSVPEEVRYKYVNDLEGSLDDLEDLSLYKVSLGQFDDANLFAPADDENAYDIQEFVILEILYSFDGIVYEATDDVIESEVISPDLSGGLFDGGIFENDSTGTMAIVFWVVVGILAVVLFNKLHLDKKPGLLVLIIAGMIYILYTLGYISW